MQVTGDEAEVKPKVFCHEHLFFEHLVSKGQAYTSAHVHV